MKFRKLVQLALSSVISNKMRSFLTMLGIIIGVAAVIILVSIMDGVTGQVTDMFESLGTNSINVYITNRGGTRQIRAKDIYKFVQDNPDLYSYVTPNVTLGNATVKTTEIPDSISTTVKGVSEQFDEINSLELENGRFMQYFDVEKKQAVCVIGSYIQKEFFGDKSALGEIIKVNGTPFTVIGILKEKADSEQGSSDECFYIPYTNAAKMSSMAFIGNYTVSAKDTDKINLAVSKLKERLNITMGNSDFYKVTALKEVLDKLTSITDTLKTALVTIAGISLLVGGIGIMNIMLVSVTERTREIGIRKSLGAKDGTIMKQFVIEAGTVSGIGGIMGILLGASVSMLVGKILKLSVFPSTGAITVAFSVSVAIGIIFGYLPAKKASKLNPIDALRYE